MKIKRYVEVEQDIDVDALLDSNECKQNKDLYDALRYLYTYYNERESYEPVAPDLEENKAIAISKDLEEHTCLNCKWFNQDAKACYNCESHIGTDYYHWTPRIQESSEYWISCDEQLPDQQNDIKMYQVTIKRLSNNDIWVQNMVFDEYAGGWKWPDNDEFIDHSEFKVLAYCLLLDPYKEEK